MGESISVVTAVEKSNFNKLPQDFLGDQVSLGKWLSWDFLQEHEKGERKKGTTFIFNKYFLTNFKLLLPVSLPVF